MNDRQIGPSYWSDRTGFDQLIEDRDALIQRLDAAAQRLAEVELALTFARGTLAGIGSSCMPLQDRDSLARRARQALDTLSEMAALAPKADREAER